MPDFGKTMKTAGSARAAIVVLCCLYFLLASCRGSRNVDEAYPDDVNESFIELPEGPPETFLVDNSEASLSEAYQPRVEVSDEDALVSVFNVNLDLESSEEQILLLGKAGERDTPLRIAVISYDAVFADYVVAFEAEVRSTSTRSTDLRFLDVVGDHGIEIVCMGFDPEGRQTLDVFRKSTSPSGFGLYFEPIFSMAIAGTLEIVPVERTEAYKSGQANGESFPIVSLSAPPDASNLLDLIRAVYYWRFSEKQYVLASTTSISGADVRQEQLKQLYNSGADAFERFLDGAWSLNGAADAPLFYFEPDEHRFTYVFADIQESYNWVNTNKALVNRVAISGINDLVPYIRAVFSVQVDNLDTFRLFGTDSWNGTYRRISLDSLITAQPETRSREDGLTPGGSYTSDLGAVLTFEGNAFRREDHASSIHGVFSLYRTDVPILELRIRDSTGVIRESLRFRYTYEEEIRDGRIYRTLYLQRGIIGIYGFEAIDESSTRYEQIEELE